MLRRSGKFPDRVATAPGERVYAIGDVHGRWDLLELMLEAIARHDSLLGGDGRMLVLFTGDIIDRGPQASQCLEAARQLQESGLGVCLLGNHESLLLAAINGDLASLKIWLKNGGKSTLKSYGIEAPGPKEDLSRFFSYLKSVIPETHINFIKSLQTSYRSGDYVFVHAGVRPGVSLDHQASTDLIWIRREFLDDDRWHGAMVVHGHSVVPTVEFRPNRISIDTEAWRSGLLSCLVLTEDMRSVLTVGV